MRIINLVGHFEVHNSKVLGEPTLFASKAQSLHYISRNVRGVRVLPLIYFQVSDWAFGSDLIVQRVLRSFGTDSSLIVRSSSVFEDTALSSMAGHFQSLPNVRGEEALRTAIDSVIASYGQHISGANEVLIQPMANHVSISGVITTPNRKDSPQYWVANTSLESTFDVTSGKSICRSTVFTSDFRPDAYHILGPVFDMVDTLTTSIGSYSLDIEFGIDALGPILFQLRPLVDVHRRDVASRGEGQRALEQAVRDVVVASSKYPHEKIAYGVMPDWNPAEMIGIKPRPLSFDLYSKFMTDSSWAIGRTMLGYSDLSSRKLMCKFAGCPYIDINASISSLLPASLPEAATRSIVLSCLKKLQGNPHFHDKIEFELVPSVLTPLMLIDISMSTLNIVDSEYQADLIKGLHQINVNIFKSSGEVTHAISVIDSFQSALSDLNSKKLELGLKDTISLIQDHISWRFSLIARSAFAATAILRELELLGYVQTGFFDGFISCIETVTHSLAADRSEMDRENFLHRYGHIRPGTYDIRNLSYREGYDNYFAQSSHTSTLIKTDDLRSPDVQLDHSALGQILQKLGIELSWSQFLSFCTLVIKQREHSKFIYSGFISHALDRIIHWGSERGLTRDHLSFLELSDIMSADSSVLSTHKLMEKIEKNKLQWELDSALRAPYLLFQDRDFYGFEEFISQPSFITRGEVKAPAFELDASHTPELMELAGRIILIESADPGFDWIFSQEIAGFVTAFGGENSHMAIRAREFMLPAVIGLGQSKYRSLASSSFIHINCSELKVESYQ